MTDRNCPGQANLSDRWDEFVELENEMRWTSEHTLSLGALLGGLAIIAGLIALGLTLG